MTVVDSRALSLFIHQESCKVIPGGVNSPVRSFASLGLSPLIAESGKGAHLVDVDGKSYFDFCLSWGSLILGHAHPQVLQGVHAQIEKGTSFGLSTEIEKKLAEKIKEFVPSIEKIRFVSSGTEALMSVSRLARAVTKRAKIIKFTGHYHGHSDAFLVQAGSSLTHLNPQAMSKGVFPHAIADTICLPFNDFEAIRALFQSEEASQIAGVVLEPVAGNMGVVLPKPGFLELLRTVTKNNGSLLIFDEVITGFRLSPSGAEGMFQIEPDLRCFGKIIGGGFPVAAFGGKAALMDELAPLGEVYQAGTLSGNPVSMRAGLETLSLLEEPGFYEKLGEQADWMAKELKKALRGKNGCVQHCSSMLNLFFGVRKVEAKEDLKDLDQSLFAKFFRYLFERGVLISPSAYESWFFSSAHSDADIERAVSLMVEFIEREL